MSDVQKQLVVVAWHSRSRDYALSLVRSLCGDDVDADAVLSACLADHDGQCDW